MAKYVKRYNLKHLGTVDILVEAFNAGHIDEAEGNNIWHNMLGKEECCQGLPLLNT